MFVRIFLALTNIALVFLRLNRVMERYRRGHNEAVLKTVCLPGHMGSNPILSVYAVRRDPRSGRIPYCTTSPIAVRRFNMGESPIRRNAA